MHEASPDKFAAQLYGVLTDLADGQEVHPADAEFLDGAEIDLYRDTTPPMPGHGLRARLATGQVLHITVEEQRHHVDTPQSETST